AAHTALVDPPPSDDWACSHVRPLLAASGGAPPTREALRRHVTTCESCTEFRTSITRVRRWLSIVLPVMPSDALVAPAPPAPPRSVEPAPVAAPPRPRGLSRVLRRG